MIDKDFWKNKRVFVTGNTGFKGSWLSQWLVMLGANVTGYALRPNTNKSLFEILGLAGEMKWVEGDIRDYGALEAALVQAEPELIIHMAAQPLVRDSYEDPVGTYSTNVMGTVNLLNSARQLKSCRSIVNVTTDKCYENREWVWGYREDEPMGGHDPYSNSKGCSELVSSAFRKSFGLPLATARAGNVIGGGDYSKDRLIPDILRASAAKTKIAIRSPEAIRPWQHVLEPLSGYLVLAQRVWDEPEKYCGAWNFGPRDEDAKTVKTVVEKLSRLIPGFDGYTIDKSPQPHEATYLKLDTSKACTYLGWQPVWDLDVALQKIADWQAMEDNAREITKQQIAEHEELSGRLYV